MTTTFFLYEMRLALKFKGQQVSNTNIEYVVIPRGDSNIVFIAKPVTSLDGFDAVAIEPKPPLITYPESTGKPPENDFSDPNYIKRLNDYVTARYYWMVLTSLKDSPDIEWETIDMSKPDTFKNFETELVSSQFLPAEINAIRGAVSRVNALDDRQLDEARKSFLASQQAPQTL